MPETPSYPDAALTPRDPLGIVTGFTSERETGCYDSALFRRT
jgi:hypothetical protein